MPNVTYRLFFTCHVNPKIQAIKGVAEFLIRTASIKRNLYRFILAVLLISANIVYFDRLLKNLGRMG